MRSTGCGWEAFTNRTQPCAPLHYLYFASNCLEMPPLPPCNGASVQRELLLQIWKKHDIIKQSHVLLSEASCSRREPVEDDEYENVTEVKYILGSKRRLSIRLINEELNLLYSTVQIIVSENFKMRNVCAKFAPRNLSVFSFDLSLNTWNQCIGQATFPELSHPCCHLHTLVHSILSYMVCTFSAIGQYSKLTFLWSTAIQFSRPDRGRV